ncbi:actin-domain-containing protein [Schizophyllum fasciatum]
MDAPIVILDNGGATIKAGVVGVHQQPFIIPNAVVRSKGDKKTYVGHEFAQCSDYSSLHFRLPVEKGFVTDWDAQKAVWDGVFSQDVLGINTQQSSLILTEPYFNLPNIQTTYDQFVFEEYEFKSNCRRTPASFAPYSPLFYSLGLPPPECSLILDCGFSFSHAVPVINSHVQWYAVKRVPIGGKLLTNHLKSLLSFRQWNLMEQPAVINHAKETCCFVSTDFAVDMERARHDPGAALEYVLPDLTRSPHGHIRRSRAPRSDSGVASMRMDILRLANERSAVPELLFTPGDIGLPHAGIAHAVAAAIAALPEDLRALFWANIGLVGGSVKFLGFKERLMLELESLAPTGCDVVIYNSDDPITAPYHGAHALATSAPHALKFVTRAEYLEHGSRPHYGDWCRQTRAPRGRVRRDEAGERRGTGGDGEGGAHEGGGGARGGGGGGGGGRSGGDSGSEERSTESVMSSDSSEPEAPRKRRKSVKSSEAGAGRGGGPGRGSSARQGAGVP